MVYFYIDHKTYQKSEEELAKLSLFHKEKNFIDQRFGMSLITCHRIEYCIPSLASATYFDVLFKDFNKILDSEDICGRLLRIALGLDSKIIGENTIFKQVAKSVNSYLYNSPQNKNYMNILVKAKEIRDQFQFYAKNHGQLIYDYIKNGQGKTILFFGAGLLNQTITHLIDYPNDYQNIILVTRNPQKAKKYFTDVKFPLRIAEIDKINKKILTPCYDIFIATDRIDHLYKKKIIGLCTREECLNIADVSSLALGLSGVTNKYFSLYSENTQGLVEESNLKFREKQIKIEKYLKDIKSG